MPDLVTRGTWAGADWELDQGGNAIVRGTFDDGLGLGDLRAPMALASRARTLAVEADTSRLTTMSGLFEGFESLERIDVTGLDTSWVRDMSGLFCGCRSLRRIDGIGDWDTTWVRSMGHAFAECRSLEDLAPIAGWDTSQVRTMVGMFYGCDSLQDLSALSGWDTSRVRGMYCMFEGCKALHDLSGLAGWDTSSLRDISHMFRGCVMLADVSPISAWDVSSVTDMTCLFDTCESLTSLSSLDTWDTSRVRSMEHLVCGCQSLVDASVLDTWDLARVEGLDALRREVRALPGMEVARRADGTGLGLFDPALVAQGSRSGDEDLVCGLLDNVVIRSFALMGVSRSALEDVMLPPEDRDGTFVGAIDVPYLASRMRCPGDEVESLVRGVGEQVDRKLDLWHLPGLDSDSIVLHGAPEDLLKAREARHVGAGPERRGR